MNTARADYKTCLEALSRRVQQSGGTGISLNKPTSNLFRTPRRDDRGVQLSGFNHLLEINSAEGWVDVEGLTTYQELVKQMLKHNVMPTVVPQLKSITIGGAVSGLGLEASSFKYGLVHEGIIEVDVLLADGRVVTATPDNEYRDLFFGLPNSYGTLGYILRLKAKAIPVKPYVKLNHQRFSQPKDFFAAIKKHIEVAPPDIDFIDGVVFSPSEHYLTTGIFTDEAPSTSDYTFKNIYYQSIREKTEDFLTTHDFIWRWDTDWFWCSKNLGMQHPFIRQLVGRRHLNSVTYTKLMRLSHRWNISDTMHRLRGLHVESVIQDVDTDINRAVEFLAFFHKEIGLTPIWICPNRQVNPSHQFDLVQAQANTNYINFGFWDVIKGKRKLPTAYYNKKIERKIQELGGFKSLYSSVHYDRDTFWRLYNGPAYRQLKSKYDPNGTFVDLFDRVVKQVGV